MYISFYLIFLESNIYICLCFFICLSNEKAKRREVSKERFVERWGPICRGYDEVESDKGCYHCQ